MKSFRLSLIFSALMFTLVLAFPAFSQAAATVTLTRNPAPPQVVPNDGTGVIAYQVNISFTSSPHSYEVQIWHDANNNGALDGLEAYIPSCAVNTNGISANLSGQPSPVVRNGSCAIANGANAGAYRIAVAYRTNDNLDANLLTVDIEHEAITNFTVSTPNLVIVKFDDANGNSVQDAGEALLPNWEFTVLGPVGSAFNPAQTLLTDTTGRITLTLITAGQYTATETLQSGWVNVTPLAQNGNIALTGQTVLRFANARPAAVCGVAYLDENKNGVRDAGEEGRFNGVGISLTNGQTLQTGGAGGYCFAGLVPGSYSASAGLPAGPYYACGDVDGPSNGIQNIGPFSLVGGQTLLNRDFGYCERDAILTITKSVNRKVVRQGTIVIWTITVRSTGPVTARNVMLSDPLIRNSTLVSTGGGVYKAGKLTWKLGNMAPGTSKTVRFKTKFDRNAKTGMYTNKACTSASNAAGKCAIAKTRVVKAPRRIVRPPAVTG